MMLLRTVLLSVVNKWHFKGNRCPLVYRVAHRMSEVENRRAYCILHKDESLYSVCSDLCPVSVITNGSFLQKVCITFIYFISLMSTRSVEHDKMSCE